jgi:hypothetical protein
MCANGWAAIRVLLRRTGRGQLALALGRGGEAIRDGSRSTRTSSRNRASGLARRGRLVATLDVGLTYPRRRE